MRKIRVLGMSLVLAATAACAQMCAAEQVAMGVARLTIRNADAVLTALNEDEKCGFSSPAVLAGAQVTGAVGLEGTITWTVTGCVLDFDKGTVLSKNCIDKVTKVSGKVTVDATRTITGIITGNPASPIIPTSPDAVVIKASKLAFDGFYAESSDSDAYMIWREGSLSGTVLPRLARSLDGPCAVQTKDIGFKDVKYKDAVIVLKAPDQEVEVTVEASDLRGQNGAKGKNENVLEGSITTWGTAHELPIPGDSDGLDPEYDRAKFVESFMCKEGIADPLSYECADLTPKLADGAARLTVKLFASAAGVVAANTSCGFAAPAVLGAASFSGSVGGEGSMTLTVSNCQVTLPADTVVSTDCTGEETLLGGSFTASGTQTVTGRLTGDPVNPVVPLTDAPAEIELSLSLSGLKVGTAGEASALLVSSGSLSGSLTPRMAAAAANGVCSVKSSVARFSDLSYSNAELALTSDSGTFALSVGSADLEAINGTWDGSSNTLSGTVQVGDQTIAVPSDGAGLNPDFSQASFDASWQCNPDLADPVSFLCGDALTASLADGASRLTAKLFGAVAGVIAADSTCGFAAPAVLGAASLQGEVGGEGSMTLTVTDCEVTLPADTPISTDCNGVQTRLGGSFTVSGTQTISGLLSGVAANPVIPISDGPATVQLAISFDGAKVSSSADVNALQVVTGTLEGSVTPRTALDGTLGVCAVKTGIARMQGLTYGDAELVLTSSSGIFNLDVATSDLDMVNGTWGGSTNVLSGTITVDEQSVSVPSDDLGLDPSFQQASFDATWQCNPALTTPVSYACVEVLSSSLADGAARLTVKLMGAIASALAADNTCGFAAPSVLGAPTFDGTVGGEGSMTLTVTDCQVTLPANSVVSIDCAGAETHLGGTFTASGTQVISGHLSGNPQNPVIPLTDGPAVVTLDVDVDDLVVSNNEDINALRVVSGSLSGSVTPRVALGTTGACSIKSGIARLGDLIYTGATLELTSDSGTFGLDVGSSSLDAVNGTWGADSNALAGSLTLDGTVMTIPSDGMGLDPEFDQAAFDASWQCQPGLIAPVSHACTSLLYPTLASGAARLTVRNFATAVSLLNANSACGFEALAVLGTAVASGTPGHIGTLTFSVDGCEVGFDTAVPVSTDCNGVQTLVVGHVTATGTKTVTGLLTGIPTSPIIPASSQPAVFDLSLELDGFEVTTSASSDSLAGVSGTLTGSLTPTTALAVESGACEVRTAIAAFDNLSYTDAVGTLKTSSGIFGLELGQGTLNGLNGSDGELTNLLAGSLTVGGQSYSVPADGLGLDPAYNQTSFDAGWQCNPALARPISLTCNPAAPLALNAVRGLVKAVGVANKMLEANSSCGFSAAAVLSSPSVGGSPGGNGVITWTVPTPPDPDGCVMTLPADTLVAIDCTGTTTHVGGTVKATSTKAVSGFLTGATPPIVPNDREAVVYTHAALVFDGFQVYSLASGETEPGVKISVSGTVTGTVEPIAGESDSLTHPVTSGAVYSIATPVARFGNLQLTSGQVTLTTGGQDLSYVLSGVDLDALTGSFGGQSNQVSGSATVNGTPASLPPLMLDPDFDQASYDASYVCTPDLKEPVPAN